MSKAMNYENDYKIALTYVLDAKREIIKETF